mgnify:CR=1 FL=1
MNVESVGGFNADIPLPELVIELLKGDHKIQFKLTVAMHRICKLFLMPIGNIEAIFI